MGLHDRLDDGPGFARMGSPARGLADCAGVGVKMEARDESLGLGATVVQSSGAFCLCGCKLRLIETCFGQ